MGQPKIKYWKLHELHKNEVKNVHPINEHMPTILNFEQLLKHITRVFPKFGGVNSILWG